MRKGCLPKCAESTVSIIFIFRYDNCTFSMIISIIIQATSHFYFRSISRDGAGMQWIFFSYFPARVTVFNNITSHAPQAFAAIYLQSIRVCSHRLLLVAAFLEGWKTIRERKRHSHPKGSTYSARARKRSLVSIYYGFHVITRYFVVNKIQIHQAEVSCIIVLCNMLQLFRWCGGRRLGN